MQVENRSDSESQAPHNRECEVPVGMQGETASRQREAQDWLGGVPGQGYSWESLSADSRDLKPQVWTMSWGRLAKREEPRTANTWELP